MQVGDETEARIKNEMISDMEYAITWMRSGQQPNAYSNAPRTKSAYDRRTLLKNHQFPSLDIVPEVKLTEAKKVAVMNVIRVLTERQLTCFLLHTAHMRTMQEIADELGLKKGTVQDHIEKAKEKISKVAENIEV